MRQHRLVTRFSPVKKTVLGSLKRLNQCRQVSQQSPKWKIFIGTSKGIVPPEGMHGIVEDIVLTRIPPQQIIIFESDDEAYVAVCQTDFIPTVMKMAAVADSEKTFAYVKQLAP